MTSPVKASVIGASGVEVGDALAGVRAGGLLIVVRDGLVVPHPARPHKARPPAANTSRRVQFLLSASKPFVFSMEAFYHIITQAYPIENERVFDGIGSYYSLPSLLLTLLNICP